MRLLMITDIHWGIRNNSPFFYDKFRLFFDNIFFPYLKENEIDHIIMLGDLVDARKAVSTQTLYFMRKIFLEPLNKLNIPTDFICGNHDAFLKNSNQINILDEILPGYENFSWVIDDSFEWNNILLVPWINENNCSTIMKQVEQSDAKYCFGHFEFAGFEMSKGNLIEEGFSTKPFEKFHTVFSGHYHTPSKKDNIHYLGSFAQFTWSDYGDEKGFYVLDTTTDELEFIKNPYNSFEVVEYEDGMEKKFDFSSLQNTYVKVVLPEQEINQSKYLKFKKQLDEITHEAIEVKSADILIEVSDEVVEAAKNMYEFIDLYVDAAEVEESKNVKTYLKALYANTVSE